ncbi:MAG: hypothetical protein IT385_11720 [Deltaproteobacteria bacterium]|nr:hypothetical protein [Deltaproteobacteria bacterium]
MVGCGGADAVAPVDATEVTEVGVTEVGVTEVEVTEVEVAEVEVAEVVEDTSSPPAPLDDTPGIGAHLVALELAADAPGPVSFVVDVAADGMTFTLGAAPGFWRIPSPEDTIPKQAITTAWTLAPGQRVALDPPALLAWAPSVTTLDVGLAARDGDRSILVDAVRLEAGAPSVQRVTGDAVTLTIAARTGAVALAPEARVGLTLDGQLAADDLAARVRGPIVIKQYAGARRWLLRPGCESEAACAEGGASHPCVSTCACACDDAGCDCDFTALEETMEAQALAAARRILGAESGADELARARVHWVFKRSLGGTASCDAHGELDVSPATWGRFFAAATRAAIAINERLGFRLIDVLSPMNEANHPLQDGSHTNAAGQPTLGGLITFVELVRQASCAAGRCCPVDRYIVEAPDVPALVAAAMAAAADVLAERAAPLAPEVALSLYLDSEQADPLQTGPDGLPPAIVTPVAPFMRAFSSALAGRAFDDDLVVVDTSPGSWGAPWFESSDGIVHHMEPATRRVVRVDPIAAADAAVTRALAAADDFEDVVGARPEVLLGEVGWSTFDGDEAAQAAFAARLVDATAASRAAGSGLSGFIWFKTHDRADFAYPTWTTADNPLGGGDPIGCDVPVLGAIVCAADVLARMEGQWGLARRDGTRKPAWEALVGRWAR